MKCTRCKNGKMKLIQSGILVDIYKCNKCGHDIKITYPNKDKKI